MATIIYGPHAGLLVAGRSLRVVEEYESALRNLVFAGWVAIVILVIGSAALLNRAAAPSPVRS